jgi:predicted nucleotidyltransferase
MDEITATREKLSAVARQYAEALRSRPDIAGLLLYGSLVHGGVTPFSDVDIAAVCSGSLPPYDVEHRIVDGVKVDVIFARLEGLRELSARLPRHLWDESPVSSYVLESLLIGGMDTVLYDPTGEIIRVKEELARRTSYRDLAATGVADWFQQIVEREVPEGSRRLEEGDYGGALHQFRSVGDYFAQVIRALTADKDLGTAATNLGIPEFAVILAELLQLASPDRGAAEELWAASRRFLDTFLEHAYEPIREKLMREGVSNPDRLELIGAYQLFWMDPNCRLHELGRFVGELDRSLQWARWEIDRGNLPGAMGLSLACQQSDWFIQRWLRMGKALADTGHDCSEIIESLLNDPEYRRLAAEVDQAFACTRSFPATAEQVARAHAHVEELRALLQQALPPTVDR